MFFVLLSCDNEWYDIKLSSVCQQLFKFFIKQGYKDSNLEMTESESVALPFGDSPIWSAGGGIRTHAPLRTNGFQDRLVMTTSIPLHESGWWESNPRIQLGRLVFYHWTTPAYLIVNKSGWQDSNLRPPGPKPGALAKLSHTPICCFAVSFLLPHRSDSDIISSYPILVNTFLHFFEIYFSNTLHPAFLRLFRWFFKKDFADFIKKEYSKHNNFEHSF